MPGYTDNFARMSIKMDASKDLFRPHFPALIHGSCMFMPQESQVEPVLNRKEYSQEVSNFCSERAIKQPMNPAGTAGNGLAIEQDLA